MEGETCHVGAQFGGGDGGEIGCAGVVFAAAYDCYSPHLPCGQLVRTEMWGCEIYLCGISRALVVSFFGP